MRYRTLGRTGIKVSAYALGAGPALQRPELRRRPPANAPPPDLGLLRPGLPGRPGAP
jgi:hypothetical protein